MNDFLKQRHGNEERIEPTYSKNGLNLINFFKNNGNKIIIKFDPINANKIIINPGTGNINGLIYPSDIKKDGVLSFLAKTTEGLILELTNDENGAILRYANNYEFKKVQTYECKLYDLTDEQLKSALPFINFNALS